MTPGENQKKKAVKIKSEYKLYNLIKKPKNVSRHLKKKRVIHVFSSVYVINSEKRKIS
jgi:hypothetical protein